MLAFYYWLESSLVLLYRKLSLGEIMFDMSTRGAN